MSVLEKIAARALEDAQARAVALPIDALRARVTIGEHRFAANLQSASKRDGLALIAELKKASPSEGAIRPDVSEQAVIEAYVPHAAGISVLTEPHWFGGSLDVLDRVRAITDVPLLRKDFLTDPYQLVEARAHGADAVLLIVALFREQPDYLAGLIALAHSLGMDTLVETHDEEELRIALDCGARIVGVNNRNLHTLSVDLATFDRLAARLPDDVIAVAESGYSTRAHIAALRAGRADAVLIGTHFMRAPNITAAVRELFA